MYWIDAIGEQLLLLLKEANDEVFTELLPLKPFISIYSVKDIK
ncbi:hypothetical protein [Niabella ginsenosidivorans]|nr:hypothetical protein [Niabella ginsenosidivorans]